MEALAQEKIWFDKYKYEEAEKAYYESLSQLHNLDEFSNLTSYTPKTTSVSCLPVPKHVEHSIVKPVPNPTAYIYRRFKLKNRNKTKMDVEKKVEKTVIQENKVSSNNAIMKNTLAEEVAKARQHIKSSLECMDGLAQLTSESIAVEFNNRLNSLETENAKLKKDVNDLTEITNKLNKRITALENAGSASSAKAPTPSTVGKSGSASSAKPVAKAPSASQKPASKPKVEDDDDGVDLFGSDSEEEDEDAKKVKEQRLAEYAARKSKKPVLIAKSNIILDVKPWDDETDMKKMEAEVRKVTLDGLIWGASKLVPLAYGIHKLQISCVVEDDKVSVDWLQEQLEAIEDYIQSVDIAAFNKV